MMMTLLKIIIQRARKRERVGNGKDENGRIYFKKKTKEKIPIVITKKKNSKLCTFIIIIMFINHQQ